MKYNKIDVEQSLKDIKKNSDHFWSLVFDIKDITINNISEKFKEFVINLPKEYKIKSDDFIIKEFNEFYSNDDYKITLKPDLSGEIRLYININCKEYFSIFKHKVNKGNILNISPLIRHKPSSKLENDIQISYYFVDKENYSYNNSICQLSDINDELDFLFGDIKTTVTFNSGKLICGNRFHNIDKVEKEYNKKFSINYNGGIKNTAEYLGEKGIGYIQTTNTSVYIIKKDNDIKIIDTYNSKDKTFKNGDYGYNIMAEICCDVWRVELVDKLMIDSTIENRFEDVYEKETFEFNVEPGIYSINMSVPSFNGYCVYGELTKM